MLLTRNVCHSLTLAVRAAARVTIVTRENLHAAICFSFNNFHAANRGMRVSLQQQSLGSAASQRHRNGSRNSSEE